MNTMINRYPGHMKKTKDMMVENLKIVDIVIELLDARIPLSSKNPDIEKMSKNKVRVLVLNKIDLVDEGKLKEWEDYFLNNDIADYFIPLSVEKNKNFSELRNIINNIYNEKLEKMKKKGLRKTVVRALIAGIPNVGKSKFINKFSNKNKAKVGNKPGFTRGKQWISVDEKFELLDTPGILWPKFEDELVSYNLAITGSIKDDVLPLEKVLIRLLDIMRSRNLLSNLVKVYDLNVEDIYKIDNIEILKVLEKRLGISKNDEFDFTIIAKRILKEYRMGKLGRFLLELPEDFGKKD